MPGLAKAGKASNAERTISRTVVSTRMRRGCFVSLLAVIGIPFGLLFGLAVFAQLTCPKGADCTIDPTEQSMPVRILNDSAQAVILEEMSCPPEDCEHDVVPPNRSVEVNTSDRGAENLYRAKDRNGNTLGCFPLLYFRRPSVEPTVRVSLANQCLTISNDTRARVLVEVRCEMDCDFESVGTIEPAQAIIVGASMRHQYRVSAANGPSFWPSPRDLLGYAPESAAGATTSLKVSALVHGS